MNLTFENLSAAYGKHTVLQDISLEIPQGSLVAVAGCNGAGKSTLLHCLTGIKKDYRGAILADGKDIRHLSMQELSQKISFLPQALPMPHVTVWELICFGRCPYISFFGKPGKADEEKIRWAIDAVGLTPYQDAFVDTLSGGQRKKAFFAMTLAQDTPIVALDEPTAHLDAKSRFEFLSLIDSLCKSTRKTFLLVMHNLPDILQYTQRILVLSDSQIVFDGTPDACLQECIPQQHFGIDIRGNAQDGYAVLPVKEKLQSDFS